MFVFTWSYEICPSCGFQLGVTDEHWGLTYDEWRKRIEQGVSWSIARASLPDWDPAAHLHAQEGRDSV